TSPASTADPTTADKAAPPARIGVSGLSNSLAIVWARLGLSASRPDERCRLAASALLSPAELALSLASTASVGMTCQGTRDTGGTSGACACCRAAQQPCANASAAAALTPSIADRAGPGLVSAPIPPSTAPP